MRGITGQEWLKTIDRVTTPGWTGFEWTNGKAQEFLSFCDRYGYVMAILTWEQ